MRDYLTETNWEDLLYSLKTQETVLFIGPEAIKNNNGESLIYSLYEDLIKKQPELIYDYNKEDGMFLFKEEMYKGRFVREIKKFYSKLPTPELYNKIAQIPFHFIISCTQDSLLPDIFQKFGLNYEFKNYSITPSQVDISMPTKEKPLIYNVFGDYNGDNKSIILSYDDLFHYLQSILSKRGLPEQLFKEFQASNEIIFLGFRFDKWYMQLLLRIFELNTGKFAFNRIASGSVENNRIKELTYKQSKIKFIDENIDEFIDIFYNKCKNDNEIKLRDIDKKDKIQERLKEVENEKIHNIKERIKRLHKLLSDWELKLDLSSDPTEQMKSEIKIQQYKTQIKQAKNELKNI